MSSDDRGTRDGGWLRRSATAAYEGVVGNAAWTLLLVALVAAGAFLRGSVPAWLFVAATACSLAAGGFIAASERRHADRLRGERDEARRHEEVSARRIASLQEDADAAKTELRAQLAAAAGGQVAVSTQMQSLVRQIQALRAASSEDLAPTAVQVELLVALLEDWEMRAGPDAVTTAALARWRGQERGLTVTAWFAVLQLLEARAISLGAEEALGAGAAGPPASDGGAGA